MKASMTGLVAAMLVAAPIVLAFPVFADEHPEEIAGPSIIHLEPNVEPRGGDVKVIRGSAVHPEPVARAVPAKMVPQDAVEAVAGDRLWLVDRKAGEVTGCYLVATIVAGAMRDIRCETGRLP